MENNKPVSTEVSGITAFYHKSVLLEESMEGLQLRPGGIYVDCTLGGGGHSLEILKRTEPDGVLVGLDQDPDALAAAKGRLETYLHRTHLVRSNFSKLPEVLDKLGIEAVDGILYDLGVSSYQLDNPERGFSYMQDAPLDMRMNPEGPVTARDLVNSLSERQMSDIIWRYGEERWAKRIAAFIVKERAVGPIERTGQLVSVIKKAIPAGARREGPHPAKRTFQALRIAVNDELDILRQAFTEAVNRLNNGGRICVITFHSLEDRITKVVFKELAAPCTCPPSFPVCVCGKAPLVRVITNRPVEPSETEVEENPRARSARLRVAEKQRLF